MKVSGHCTQMYLIFLVLLLNKCGSTIINFKKCFTRKILIKEINIKDYPVLFLLEEEGFLVFRNPDLSVYPKLNFENLKKSKVSKIIEE